MGARVREGRKPVLARWSDEFATQYDKGYLRVLKVFHVKSVSQAVVRTQGSEFGRL